MPEKKQEYFRIVTRPVGEAPKWVRDAWIGLTFPITEPIDPTGDRGVVSLKPSDSNTGGYSVTTDDAFRILGEHNEKALGWWQENAAYLFVFGKATYLRFGKQFCELVEVH